MALMMKKAEFLAVIGNMKAPRLTRRGVIIFVYDEALKDARMVEVYFASNFREEGYISASNQMTKYRNWLEAAK